MASPPRVLLSAFGIRMGGGLVLLKALTTALGHSLKLAAVDARLPPDPAFELLADCAIRVRRSFVARIVSLMQLSARAEPTDILLCLNSLPPLWRPRCKVITYVHALYLVDMHRDSRYTLITALRIAIERLWFKCGIRHSDECWVQTPSMASALKALHPRATVRIAPFVDDELASQLQPRSVDPDASVNPDLHHCFFYPAEAVGHKNHTTLLRAWAVLQGEQLTPQLILTLSPQETKRVCAEAGVNLADFPHIRNMGRMSRHETLEQLRQSSALLFPSLAETLGLPLLEARAMGIAIIASERNFVRDVCEPVETFDPHSSQSIASAVKRFMALKEAPLCPMNATAFVTTLLAQPPSGHAPSQ